LAIFFTLNGQLLGEFMPVEGLTKKKFHIFH
jgi:hypothetical protein